MHIFYGIIAVFLTTDLYVEAGTVYKTIIKNGTGPVPQPNQTVVVHYTGKLQTNEQFDSSRDRNEPFKFTLGAGEVIRGWDAGVSSMRVGERAELEIAPEDGYGADGYPPVIPPSATLLFDIELLAIEGVTPMPPQPAFGSATDVATMLSASSQSGSTQTADLSGFGVSSMFDSQGFSSTGSGRDSSLGLNGFIKDSGPNFSPQDLPMSNSGMMSTGMSSDRGQSGGASSMFSSGMSDTNQQRGSLSSFADTFSTSMSGSAGSFPDQRSSSSSDGRFDFGRGGAGDALFGSQGGSMSDSFSTRGLGDTSSGFPTGSSTQDTRIPGMDISRAGRTEFDFGVSPTGTDFSGSNRGGSFGSSLDRTVDSGSMRFGSGSPSGPSPPRMDMGIGASFGPSPSSPATRDFGSSMPQDRFGSSGRDFSSGSFPGESSSGLGRMSAGMPTFGSGVGMGAAGPEMVGGMGSDGRMSSLPGIGGGMSTGGPGSDRMGFGMDERMTSMSGIGGRMGSGMGSGMGTGIGSGRGFGPSGSDIGFGMDGRTRSMAGLGGGSGMGMGATGTEMSGGMRSSMSGQTGTLGGSFDSRPGMTGAMGPGVGGRFSSISDAGGRMGAGGSEMSGGFGPMMPSMTGMGTSRPEMPGGMGFMGAPGGGTGFDRSRTGIGGMPSFAGMSPDFGSVGPGMRGGPGSSPEFGSAGPGMRGGPGSSPDFGSAGPGMRGGPGFGPDFGSMGPGMRGGPGPSPGFGSAGPAMRGGPGPMTGLSRRRGMPGTMPGRPGMRPGPGAMPRPMGPGMMPPFMRPGIPPFMRRRMLGFRR